MFSIFFIYFHSAPTLLCVPYFVFDFCKVADPLFNICFSFSFIIYFLFSVSFSSFLFLFLALNIFHYSCSERIVNVFVVWYCCHFRHCFVTCECGYSMHIIHMYSNNNNNILQKTIAYTRRNSQFQCSQRIYDFRFQKEHAQGLAVVRSKLFLLQQQPSSITKQCRTRQANQIR